MPVGPGPVSGPVPVPGPAPGPGQLPPGALPPLGTVPVLPEYGNVPINRSSDAAAILSAAEFVRRAHPQWFMVDDRAVCLEIMTKVIGILRAHGYDAHRVVNHAGKPVGDPWRYGSDALVLNGIVWDVYRGIGDPNQSVPQALNVGRYEPGRPRE
ncbi:MAG: hypothetical protein FJZ00_14495 [Candidatus Sericytochromatia bacterium]|uniref:Uncharacterized protein n=1 Tax=Candidatus Tanganyikabacteria bacterium TaxID=2961651 RepID=A0A937X941_9BACT|nr:hypothetical protein [Candidatus Tanganyikabacteria bacterium]